MFSKLPISKSGNPRWDLWLKVPLTDEQRAILTEKNVEILEEGSKHPMYVIATTEETARWLESRYPDFLVMQFVEDSDFGKRL